MPDSTSRVTVAVIFGGVSSEHDVSCLTAGGVTRTMDPDRYDVIGVGITPAGTWTRLSREELAAMEVVNERLPRLDEDVAPAALLPRVGGGGAIASIVGDNVTDVVDFDIAFPLLHGPFGEDGTLQGLFEMYGIRYVGAGVAASATCMDKDLMKRALKTGGLPVGPWVTFLPSQWRDDPAGCLAQARKLTLPLFVKPARGGSSVGITRIDKYEDLPDAVAEAQRFDPKVVVEQGFTDVREIECAVLEDATGDAPHVSYPGEVVMHTPDKFYDFNAKYLPGSQVTLNVPAAMSEELQDDCRAVAARAFTALLVEGLARVDLFASASGGVFVNEINTLPGFTRFSMYPMMWEASGIAYPVLIDRLIELAMSRPLGLR